MELINKLRRKLEQTLDQTWALSTKKLTPLAQPLAFEGEPRFALVTVNFSTTHYLKLMLLTLCGQTALNAVKKIIIVDNASKDGGKDFLRKLASACEKVHLVENRLLLNHARGLRKGIAHLDRLESDQEGEDRCNLLLICDTDIIFLRPETLQEVARALSEEKAALAGELRHGLYEYPEAQASFLVLRRDIYIKRKTAPFVNHGAPAYWLQRSLWKQGEKLADFPSNKAGYILHRGRSGVEAAARHHKQSSYATTNNKHPHYMGIKNGKQTWQAAEMKYEGLLKLKNEPSLITHLSTSLTVGAT